MSECSRYELGDFEDWGLEPYQRLCRCPICKGFLPQNFPMDKPFKCKKCGAELLVMPDHDEDTGEEEVESGRICPISTSKQKEEIEK